ncbi:MAG: hypothetical protein ACJ8GN_12170 [Longimicrobiaceae bacterium]
MRLREEWRALTGHRVEVERPRHAVDEVAAIFAALPQGDPRLRLLIELAAELRAGQAVRAKRSDLILEAAGALDSAASSSTATAGSTGRRLTCTPSFARWPAFPTSGVGTRRAGCGWRWFPAPTPTGSNEPCVAILAEVIEEVITGVA